MLIANKIKLGWAQILLSIALIIISIIILLEQKEVSVMPRAGTSDSLEVWWKYLLGTMIFFGLGILQSLGIGIYAPAMAVTYLMGLSSLFVLCFSNYDGVSSLFNTYWCLSFY